MPRAKHRWLWIIVICSSSFGFAQDKPSVPSAAEKVAAALVEAKTDEERAALLAANKELVTVELQQALIKEGNLLSNQGDYPQALTIFHLAQNIAEQIGDKAGIAHTLNGIGTIHFSQGNYEQALEYYQKSLALEEELKDNQGIATILNNIGIILHSQGNYEQALEYYQKSLALSEELKDKAGISRTLNGIGNIHYSRGNYGQALDYYQKSLALKDELKDKYGIAGTLHNIGYIYYSQGDYEQALEHYRKSLALRKEIKDKAGIAATLNNIGIVYKSQGDYRQALEYYQKSLALKDELKDKEGITFTLNNIGNIHSSQSNYGQALGYYQKSLALSEELKDKYAIASTLNNIGIIYESQGNYGQALDYYQKSLALRQELKDKDGIAGTLNGIGNTYLFQGNYEQALEHYRKGLVLSEESKDKVLIATTLNNLGLAHCLKGNNEQVLEFADQATNLGKQTGELEQIWRARRIAGVAYHALNKPNQSRQAFEEAIRTIETIRAQAAGGEQEQQFFFEDKISPYHEMVDLLISQNNNSEALGYAERAKARVILDVLQSGKVNITKAMTPQEQEHERKLNNELVSLNTQIYREKQREQPDKSRIADLEKHLEKARLDLEAFQTNLYAAHPELKVKRVEVLPVTLEQARALLPDPQSALLEFVVAEEKSYLFVLTSETLKVYTLDIKRKDLAERVSSFRELLATKNLAFRKPGHELYDLLLKPAQEQLSGKTTLIIVPEGVLWELPFQALQTPKNRYLLEDHTLFYAPSLTALREMVKLEKKRTANPPTLLALGNPALGKQTIERIKSGLMDEKLDPLPAAEEQVKQLAKLYGPDQSKFYIGADAREERVKAEAGNYRFLQFATHGILNNASPMYSHLVLSQTEENGNEDGLLEAWEIAQMDLQAELAVLAACETARGRVGAGEGMIGLTWALFVAGCPTTVVSQWKVEDAATKDLMLEFHRTLKTRLNSKSQISKAEALRQAELKLMRAGKDPHPFYWAGFVLVGDGR